MRPIILNVYSIHWWRQAQLNVLLHRVSHYQICGHKTSSLFEFSMPRCLHTRCWYQEALWITNNEKKRKYSLSSRIPATSRLSLLSLRTIWSAEKRQRERNGGSQWMRMGNDKKDKYRHRRQSLAPFPWTSDGILGASVLTLELAKGTRGQKAEKKIMVYLRVCNLTVLCCTFKTLQHGSGFLKSISVDVCVCMWNGVHNTIQHHDHTSLGAFFLQHIQLYMLVFFTYFANIVFIPYWSLNILHMEDTFFKTNMQIKMVLISDVS